MKRLFCLYKVNDNLTVATQIQPDSTVFNPTIDSIAKSYTEGTLASRRGQSTRTLQFNGKDFVPSAGPGGQCTLESARVGIDKPYSSCNAPIATTSANLLLVSTYTNISSTGVTVYKRDGTSITSPTTNCPSAGVACTNVVRYVQLC